MGIPIENNTATTQAANAQGQAPPQGQHTSQTESKSQTVVGDRPRTDAEQAEADRKYEEAIEEEYAKREGGA